MASVTPGVVKRQGWELNDPKISSRQYRASFPVTSLDSSGRSSSSNLVVVNNIATGTFDVYEPGGFGFGRPFASYSPANNKLIPSDQSSFNKFFNQNTPTGKSQLTKITEGAKLATFDLANLNATTDPVDKENFEKLKKLPGYKSIANQTPAGGRTPAAVTGGGTSPEGSPVGIASTSSTSADTDALIKEANAPYKKNTRDNYFTSPPLKYPLTLSLENQDCIKFSIIKYQPPGLNPKESPSRIVQLENKNGLKIPGLSKGRVILGTIILPIPAGINDRNYVNWSGNPLDTISQAFANISSEAILKGGPAGVDAAKSSSNAATSGGTGAATQVIVSKFVEAATGANNILSRQFGAVINQNLELLFNSPELRSFQFSFRFTPREPEEAIVVKKIIRHFKQAMSVKRSESSLLLKAPHTFAISYVTSDKQHPYLNRFKECALTDCSVSYTPDGTYMTYREPDPNKREDIQFRSMTAYEMTLSFQELEPIFDDDYYEVDQNKDTDIGF